MRDHAKPATVFLVIVMCTVLGVVPAHAASGLVVQGTVTDTAGHVVPHAYVESDGVVVRADTSGVYRLPVPTAATQVLVMAWALGYRPMPVYLSSPAGGALFGTVTTNFTGNLALPSAFRSPVAHAVLHGVRSVIPASRHMIHLHGTSQTALIRRVSVTLPTGRVASYPLRVRGRSFAATVPLGSNGPYRIEINATTGFGVFNVPVFHGMAPQPPIDPSFPPGPLTGTPAQLADYGLIVINRFRESLGLKDLVMRSELVRVAALHTADVLQHNTFLSEPHLGSNGSTPAQRIKGSGLPVHRTGETVGEGPGVAATVTSFLDSPSHRALLIGNFRWVGIGVTRTSDGILMTVDLAR